MRSNERFNFQRAPHTEVEPHAGTLLLAHPTLKDPNFSKTVILLSAHSEGEGSVGIIVNRPSDQTLREVDPNFREKLDSEDERELLEDIPIFWGGPVAREHLILVAWKWCLDESSFKLYFGMQAERAGQIIEEDPEFRLLGFMGHAGWMEGQLSSEIAADSWILSSALPYLHSDAVQIDWLSLVGSERPDLRLLALAPDDPSLN